MVMTPRMQFSRTELSFLCRVLGTLAEKKKATISTEEIKKVNTAIKQLKGYERSMVQAGMWGETYG